MTTCPRAWEVEAARDGRLTGKARQTHDAHLQTCASCGDAARALESLAQGLRELGGEDVDDVSLRRLRNRVLDVVDAEQTGRERHSAGPGRWRATTAAVVLAATVIAAVTFASWHAQRPHVEARQVPAPPPPRASESLQPSLLPPAAPSPINVESEDTRVDVTPAAGARFTRTTEPGLDRFELTEGTLGLRVQRPAGGRRVLVTVPDGEIEDVGTAFDVVVSDRRTERVSVHEGRVVVRLTNRPPVTVDAGNTWRRSALRTSERTSASTTSKPSTNGDREDAAYLEVVRLMRDGREGDARVAAARYLDDFPAGFRRAEMERVATGQRRR
jgi:hypothetical protein